MNITNANSDNNTTNSIVVTGKNNENCNNKLEAEKKKALNEDQVLKEGWLYKKKSSFFKSWKVRCDGIF